MLPGFNVFCAVQAVQARLSNDIMRTQAIALKELPWLFQGPLPPCTADESCIPIPGKNIQSMPDPLKASESTKCLVPDTSRFPGCSHLMLKTLPILLDMLQFSPSRTQTRRLRQAFHEIVVNSREAGTSSYPRNCSMTDMRDKQHKQKLEQLILQVRIFDYCIHVCNARVESKVGACLVFRRGAKPYSLVACLVHSGDIVNLLSSVLSELLASFDIRLARLTTKAAKIRRLMALEEVTEKCEPSDLQRVEALLVEQEKRRGNKKDEEAEEMEQKENQDCSGIFCLFFGSLLLDCISEGRFRLGRAER